MNLLAEAAEATTSSLSSPATSSLLSSPSTKIGQSSLFASGIIQDGQEPCSSATSRPCLEVPLEDFVKFLNKQPLSTAKSIYEKAVCLNFSDEAMVPAPGCEKGSYMVESSSRKDRPHLVLRGKNGAFKCDRTCPNFNALKLCSHTVTAANRSKELNLFLLKHKPSFDVTGAIMTDMPKNPGKKGGKGPTKKKVTVPIIERRSRQYDETAVNLNPYFLKKMNNRIKVCQGCKGSLQVNGKIPLPPHDFCVARVERRHFMDVKTGVKRLGTPSDCHYHLNLACLPNTFNFAFLQIDDKTVSNDHKSFVKSILS